MPEEYESKTIKVYGDKHAKARDAIPAYERVLRTREVTFTCVNCGNSVTEHHFPGPIPRSCEHCRADVQRKQTRERAKRSRQKKKEQSSHDR
jgi:hypothetical protein